MVKAVLPVAIVVVAAIFLFGVYFIDSDADDDRYSITYPLDVGYFVGNPIDSYVSGEYIDLPVPVRVGAQFLGWYEDYDYTIPIGAVTADREGDLTLFALWSFDRPVESSFYLGQHQGLSVTIATHLYFSGIGILYNVGVSYNGTSFTDQVRFTGYAQYLYNEVVSGYTCSVWEWDNIRYWMYQDVPMAVEYDGIMLIDGDPGYSMTFECNGGTIIGEYDGAYMSGDYVAFPSPVKDGHYFTGWYEDPELTIPIGSKTLNDRGGTTVYAQWSDSSPVGYRYEFSDISYSVYSYDGGMSFVVVSGNSCPDTALWMFGEDSKFLYTISYSGRICSVWNIGDYVVWLDSGVPVRMFHDGEYIQSTSTSTFDVGIPLVMADQGTDVTVSLGSIGYGKSVSLSSPTALDWMVDGHVVSTSSSYTIDVIMPGVSYRAASDDVRVESHGVMVSDLGIDTPISIYTGGMVLVDSFDGPSDVMLDVEPGSYLVVGGDSGLLTSLHLVIGKEITYTWNYDGRGYTLTLFMDGRLVDRYLEEYPNGSKFVSNNMDYGTRVYYYYGADSDGKFSDFATKFFTTDDRYVLEVAEELATYREGMTDLEFADFVLHFVGSIPYMSDFQSRGYQEMYKFPAETLWDNSGDCEDSSILYATLMSVLGYNSGIITIPNHVMAILDVGTVNDNGFYRGSVWYTLCETTGVFDVGQLGYNSSTGSPNDVDESEITHRLFVSRVSP